MIRLLSLFFWLALISPCLRAQEVKHSIYLIGDAGKDTLAGSALMLLEEELLANKNSTVLFLGDNIYPAGMEGLDGSKKRQLSELKLLAQLERTENHQGRVYWIPGNHDWKAGKWQGNLLVQEEASFVEAFYDENRTIKNDSGHVFIPSTGLPGPVFEEAEDFGFNVITIDLQWWLQDQFFHKVPLIEGLNKRQMEVAFLDRLDSLISLSESQGRVAIIAGHHPMFSNGHHGATKQPWRFIFNWVPPFPLFGLMGLNRALVQDIPQPRYKRIRNRVLEILDKHQNLIFVSGHDHNLQYFEKSNNHFLVSGAGSKRSELKGDRYQAKYMDDLNYGFMRLDLMEDGRIRCHVFGHTMGGIIETFWLK